MRASQLLAKARRVRPGGLGPADAALAGLYRSAFRGSGMEYEESREYAPGDDVSAIDWNAAARLGRPFVKRFREERERTLLLAVDVSRSMTFAAAGPALLETAALAAVSLAIGAAGSRDRVGLVLFSDRVETFLPPARGPARIFAVAHALAETRPIGRTTDPGPALALAGTVLRHRAALFLFSDFLAGDFQTPLGRLGGRHDLVAVALAAGLDDALPPYGLLTVADLETGRRTTLDCGDAASRARYASARKLRHDAAMAALAAAGADILPLSADVHPAPALEQFLRQRQRRPGWRRSGTASPIAAKHPPA